MGGSAAFGSRVGEGGKGRIGDSVASMICAAGEFSERIEVSANPEPLREYPWGEEADANRANYRETGIGTRSTVGCFLQEPTRTDARR